MADVFLSYAREDRACAQSLATALLTRGFSVWWDRQIPVGTSFADAIEAELDAASAVVVLWSESSVKSEWVQAEASEAARRKVLLPIRIQNVRPPLEFRRLQTADLFEWPACLQTTDFDACLMKLAHLSGGSVRHIVSRENVGFESKPSGHLGTPSEAFAAAAATPPRSGSPAIISSNEVTARIMVACLAILAFGPCGVVALRHALRARRSMTAGDDASSNQSLNTSATWAGVGIAVGILLWIAILVNVQ